MNDNYSTLAGFILEMLGNNFPQNGQMIVWEGLAFELTRVDEHEIKEIRVRHVGGEKHLYSKREATDVYDDDEEDDKDQSPRVIVVGENGPVTLTRAQAQANLKLP